MRPKPDLVTLELGGDSAALLLMAAVRYARPRHTYIVSAITEIMEQAGPQLSKIDREKLIAEVSDSFRVMEESWACDEALWDAIVKYYKELNDAS